MRLSEKIYNQIKADIESGVIDSRTFLSESQVAQQFEVSKAPVRDALHLLCNQGYLASYPRKGYMVNLFTADEINQIQTIRREIEKLSLRLVIDNATDEEIASLRECISDASDARTGAETSNAQFHMKLAQISGNKYLPEVLSDLIYKASQTQLGVKQVQPNRHSEIIDALLERDLSRAQALLDEDIAFV